MSEDYSNDDYSNGVTISQDTHQGGFEVYAPSYVPEVAPYIPPSVPDVKVTPNVISKNDEYSDGNYEDTTFSMNMNYSRKSAPVHPSNKFPASSSTVPPPSAPPSAPYPTSVPTSNTYTPSTELDEEYRMSRFRHLAEKYNIRRDFCVKLRQLEGFNIMVVIDDSGSMESSILNTADPFEPSKTRYDELKESVKIICEVATILDKDGVDLFFLNNGTYKNVKDIVTVNELFKKHPRGTTPLVHTIRNAYASIDGEKKTLLIIATDGEPNEGVDAFEKTLTTERPKDTYVTIMACTNDDSAIGYLDRFDDIIPSVDVVDDYHSEKMQIQKVQGSGFAFSFGDYIVKCLLGSIDKFFDDLDEVRVAKPVELSRKPVETTNTSDGGCCVVC